jgi:hypothetical protein
MPAALAGAEIDRAGARRGGVRRAEVRRAEVRRAEVATANRSWRAEELKMTPFCAQL